MPKFLSIFVMLMASSTLFAQEVEDVMGVSKLKFNGEKYELGWSVHNSYQYLQEYFPKGQNPEAFTEMFTISVVILPPYTALQAADAKAAELAKRKAIQKDVLEWNVYNNPERDESMIDLICFDGTEEAMTLLEYNIHRYQKIEVDGLPALQLTFYTLRVQGDEINSFVNDRLPALRQQYIQEITGLNIECKIKK